MAYAVSLIGVGGVDEYQLIRELEQAIGYSMRLHRLPPFPVDSLMVMLIVAPWRSKLKVLPRKVKRIASASAVMSSAIWLKNLRTCRPDSVRDFELVFGIRLILNKLKLRYVLFKP